MKKIQETRILFVEDQQIDYEIAIRLIHSQQIPFVSIRVETEKDFIEALHSFDPMLIISDYTMPLFDGMKALKIALQVAPEIPVIMYTGSINEETAVVCMKYGASDYILKENNKRLPYAVMEAMAKRESNIQNRLNQEALNFSETKFRSYIENAPLGIIVGDFEGYLIECNPVGSEMFGYTVEEMATLTMFDLLPPESLNEGMEQLAKVKSTGYAQVEILLKKKDGTLIWTAVTTVTLDDARIMAYCQNITERKSAEQQAHTLSQQLSHYNATSPAISYALRFDGTKFIPEWMSENITQILGYTTAEALNPDWWSSHLYPDDKNKALNTLEILLKDSQLVQEYRFYDKNGKFYWFRDESRLLRNAEGEPVEIIGSWVDITGKKQIESRMNVITKALESTANPIGILNSTGNFEWVNDAFCNMTGYSQKEIIGQKPSALINSGFHNDEYYKDLWDTLRRGNTWRGTVHNKRKDGTGYIEEQTNTPVFNEMGEITYFITVRTDITGRILDEKRLKDSELKYRSIFDNIIDVYYEISLSGTILEISPSINLLSFGLYQRNDLIGRLTTDFYEFPTDRENFLVQLKSKTSINDYPVNLKNRDGVMVPCSLSGKLQMDEYGSPVKIVGTIRNISERRKFEDELIRAKDKAEESDRLKSAFLANLSHEIRTPLNGVLGFSQLLKEPDLAIGDRDTYIDIINSSSEQLLRIIHDVVDISMVEAGQETVKLSSLNLNGLMNEIETFFQPQSNLRNLQLEFHCGLKDEASNISTDKYKLKSILLNLVGNALKFSDKGKIEVLYEVDGGNLRFAVKDQGIGIEPHHHKAIFDRFRQAEITTMRKYGGTGLGLSLSKSYVEILGGNISLESEPGKGSTFSFTIPFHAGIEGKSIEPVRVQKDHPSGFHWPGKVILVAEDEDMNFEFTATILKPTGVNILRAENGQIAVDIFRDHPEIELVLMDLKMPVMDGLEATRQIKGIRSHIPVLAFTAYVMADDEVIVKQAGCDDYITKPVKKIDLLKAIGRFL